MTASDTAGEITIDDVARLAGVSASTVSRVLSGRTNVVALKRQAVMQAVQELGYRPNASARLLASGRSMSIGVVTQDITSPFYGEVVHGIEHGLRDSRYAPLFASAHWRVDEERHALDMLLSRRVDALIVLGGATPDEYLRALSGQRPLVAVGRSIQGCEDACFTLDNVQGARNAVEHLLGLGHTRIAHIAGPRPHRDARDRLEGYRLALTDAGVPLDERLIVEGDFMEPSGLLAFEALISRGVSFSAIFAANDQMAYGVRLALFRRGIRVPEDISLVGFDDLPGSAFTTPPLTTIRQPTYDLGLAAAQAALLALEGHSVPAATFHTELVIRESTTRHRQPATHSRRSNPGSVMNST